MKNSIFNSRYCIMIQLYVYTILISPYALVAVKLNHTGASATGDAYQYQSVGRGNQTNYLKPVTVTIGRLAHIAIPFHEMDGTVFYSDEWSFVLKTVDDQPLYDRSWIQYNEEIRQIEAFPLNGNEGRISFLLIPWIKNQKSLDRYYLDLDVIREENVYMHQVVFNIGAKNSARFNRQRKFRIDFIDLLSTYLNSKGVYVNQNEILILDANPSTGAIKWLLTNMKPSTCDNVITRQLPSLLLENNKPNLNLLTVFSRKAIIISDVKIELFPPCTIYVEETQSYSNNKFLAPLIIVIVIVVLVSPVAIALIIRRKFKNDRDNRFQQTHVPNHPISAHGLGVEHVPTYDKNQGKISFSCWMFSRKGKSFKINREYQNRVKYMNDNIFDPNYLQRQRLTAKSHSLSKNSPGQLRSHFRRDPAQHNSKKKQQRQLSGFSEASSHASYSTSQDTHHSNLSIDKRRYSPTLYQPPLYQTHQQYGGSTNFLDTKCRQHEDRYHRNSTQSRDSRSNSLVQSSMSRVSNYVFNSNSNCNGSNNQSRRPSVHLINIKPKTVNIHTPAQYQQKERTSNKGNQTCLSNNQNQNREHSLERNFKINQEYTEGSKYYNMPRRHSLDARQAHLLANSQKELERRFKHLTSRSHTSTPTKGSTLRVDTFNRQQSKNAEPAYRSFGSGEMNQRLVHAQSSDYMCSRSRSAAEIKRPVSLNNLVNPSQRQPSPQKQYHNNETCYQENNIYGYQNQNQQNGDWTQYQPRNSTDDRERKTSLVRRQEFLASRRHKAVELCSHEETQYLCHMQPTPEDYEDAV